MELEGPRVSVRPRIVALPPAPLIRLGFASTPSPIRGEGKTPAPPPSFLVDDWQERRCLVRPSPLVGEGVAPNVLARSEKATDEGYWRTETWINRHLPLLPSVSFRPFPIFSTPALSTPFSFE